MNGYFVEEGSYLAHYGVLGMKWGIRRYQNYDGSYTQAGMKRYNKAKENYESADQLYKSMKTARKQTKKHGSVNINGHDVAIQKSVVTEAKRNRKKAKRDLNKHYKHLKQDKLGDQGKKLYANGKTINGNYATTAFLSTLTGLSIGAIKLQGKSSLIRSLGLPIHATEDQINRALVVLGGTTGAIGIAKGAKDHYEAKRLRAYYGHTSNY